jgi:hypothetical protein
MLLAIAVNAVRIGSTVMLSLPRIANLALATELVQSYVIISQEPVYVDLMSLATPVTDALLEHSASRPVVAVSCVHVELRR